MSEDKSVQSIDRALDIIEAVAVEQEGMGLTELADCVGLHKSTAYRIITTLVKRGYIDKTHEGNYEIGHRCIGAPIYDYRGDIIAAISASGDKRLLTDERIEEVAQYVKKVGLEISKGMGYVG